MNNWFVEFTGSHGKQLLRVPESGKLPVAPFRLVGEKHGVAVLGTTEKWVLTPGKELKTDFGIFKCSKSTDLIHEEESSRLKKQVMGEAVALSKASHFELHQFQGPFLISTTHHPVGEIDGLLKESNGKFHFEKGVDSSLPTSEWDGKPVEYAGAGGYRYVLVPVQLGAPIIELEQRDPKVWMKRALAVVLFLLLPLILLKQSMEVQEVEEMKIENIPKRFIKIRKIPNSGLAFQSPKKFGDNGGQGARKKKKAGKRGKLTEAQKAARAKRRAEKRAKVAKSAGVLSLFGNEGKLQGKKSKGMAASEIKNMVGGTSGANYGAQKGVGGFALKGVGQGGGGMAAAGVGLGTAGIGSGSAGSGTGFIEGGGTGEITLPSLEETILVGSLDKDVIRAVIARYLPQIRACYEKGITRNQSLAGRVKTQFVIGTTGAMQSAKVVKSSLGDSGVHRCMQNVMMKWKFPAPKGNGVVRVTYPFMFRPTQG